MQKDKPLFRQFALADDDTDDAGLFAEALAEVDPKIQLCLAENGKVLLDKISTGRCEWPDIIFLDVNMPEMNGWTCLGELKKHATFSKIPVIMYSTSSHVRDRAAAARLGANFFYTKPDSFQQLKEFLRYLIDHPETFQIAS
ncbi:response regulator [Pseudochryseolinea flava]|uniref:Response regulator n=1 Tax=Pseudochryseolinea flava TaxID=2059302 RepID=A0A364Y649_9BACT|nr:response regulator [Pseudochryseolinea flava]RAW02312.1 response regulator [Pseudochryseolinea flava]